MAPLTAIESSKLNVSKKRKSDGDKPHVDPDSIDVEGMPIDLDANQVRTRIRNFINSGEMKVGEFQKKIGVSSKSYGDFMGQSGPNAGTGSNTYIDAWVFFKQRELPGLPMPTKKAKTGGAAAAAAKKWDVSAIKLDGEVDERVPIFDTCNDVRRKINAHLRDPDVTKAAFGRELRKTTFLTPPAQGMSDRSLQTFLSQKGPMRDATSPLFYAAYVYFEKLRLKNKKPKSKKRQEMEVEWAAGGGMPRTWSGESLICRANERWDIDQFGRRQLYTV